ncbi:MAG: hypothetical protein M9894_17580 [Planctomycetes bacterium]|nr:hypothetical protein [Planctomycetota bacterium]
MGEPTREEFESLWQVMRGPFELVHGGPFTFVPIEGTDKIADFLLVSSAGRSIQVQHVRALTAVKNEGHLPDVAARFGDEVRQQLETAAVGDVFVSVSVCLRRGRRADLIGDILSFTKANAADAPILGRSAWCESSSVRLSEGVPAIEIWRRAPGAHGVVVGVGLADVESTPQPDPSHAVLAAIEQKCAKYGGGQPDVVLLVEPWPYPVDSFYRRTVLQLVAGRPTGFLDVWLTNNYPGSRWAERLVP